MTGGDAVVVAGPAALVVILGLTVLLAGRARRSRDLRTLTDIGRALAGHAERRGIRGERDDRDTAQEVAEALLARYAARRVVVAVGSLVVEAGSALPDGVGAVDLVAPDDAFRAGRGATRWSRRSAAGPVGHWMDVRGVAEILVAAVVAPERSRGAAPGAPGSAASARHGVIEVHDPGRRGARRPGCRRWAGHAKLRGELALLAAIARQVGAEAENTRLTARLRRDAHRDPLTGLLNRTGFLDAASTGLVAGPGAVAVVTLGLLDQVNDTLGHIRAEELVTAAARRLAALGDHAEGIRCAARLEGDTFAVVAPGPDGPAAHASARVVHELLARPLTVEGIPFEAAAFVGVALAGTGDLAGERDGLVLTTRLLARADIALAAARIGGGPVRCYEASMGERADRRLALIRGFGPAVADGHLRVHYQPTVSLEGRTVVLGVEALARWEHPELGVLMPDEFVPVLEATGQIDGLTEFVLDSSLAAVRRWLDRGMCLSVAVNVSVGSLDDAFPGIVADALARHDVPAGMLTLEVTETGVSAEREEALPALRRLRALGCRLAVDDFGTGQSSLAHLRRLPVDQVKIDKSFVLGMGTESGDVAVVRAIVEMGHTLGLTVVAEGVENLAVRAALAEMGCDVAQGYLVSKPLPVGSLESWLDSLPVVPVAGGGPRPSTAEGPCVRWFSPSGAVPGTPGAAGAAG